MKAYPCIGGPLNTCSATTKDFLPPRYQLIPVADPITGRIMRYRTGEMLKPGGFHSHLSDQYVPFNRRNSSAKVPSMVWLWKPLVEGK